MSSPATPPAFDLQPGSPNFIDADNILDPLDMPYYNTMTAAIRPSTHGATNRDGTSPSPHQYSRSVTSPIPLQRLDYAHRGSQSRTMYPGDWPLTYPRGHTSRGDTPTSDWAEVLKFG
ncbi:hypothetical protein BOTBODRAFT_174627 [Botryobasidium botryosum FD-172 SS1]|uniref:Uncharacterized protein n=1 Tax=Botryobasidium botryosum (strain FD-172 SS1) TaxID=930990 RepID=A0A067MRE5_BOTB1|nr:hypothetical protein BOTBODRAFT_174627 [Botryobasidium botryosum FD-172 SS1]